MEAFLMKVYSKEFYKTYTREKFFYNHYISFYHMSYELEEQ